MITRLNIANFKSIRQLHLDCRKVNLFIGEPNTGKSNILEALGLLSWSGRPGQGHLGDFVRFQLMQNLFFDQLLDEDISISFVLSSGQPIAELRVRFKNDNFEFRSQSGGPLLAVVTYQGGLATGSAHPRTNDIKFFRFKTMTRYDAKEAGGLKPPCGANFFSVVFASKALRETMTEFFRNYGLKLVLKPQEKVFELQKHTDDLVFSFPYTLTSDTLQRIIFYTVAMASNRDSVLVFEEPESNAFPYYTKYLGERIARDETNQFFIATHNPYLLSAIVEKSRVEDIQVFITYFKDYQTQVRPLTAAQVSGLLEADPFFNLDQFIEEGQ